MAQFNTKNEASHFLVECFEEFYREVLKHRNFVLSKPWQKTEEKGESSPQATAEYILSRLKSYLEEQEVKANRRGSNFPKSLYGEAQFIMVSLADEVFLNLDWPGKRYWEFNLLEQRMYNTHSAGQIIFEKLDNLLKNRNSAPRGLAVLYLNSLGLGFQGKYRHFNDGGILSSYRKKLFIFINRREPSLFQKKIHLFPDPYTHTIEGEKPKELPQFRNWYFIFSGLFLTYLFASYIIWYTATADIKNIVNDIMTSNAGKG